MRGTQEIILSATAKNAGRLTSKIIEDIITDSKLISDDTLDHVGRINYSEVALGKFLSEGGFNVVRQAKNADPSRPSCLSVGENAQEESEKQYAIKYLSISKVRKGKKFARGSADLAIEAHFLASLNHPNIIKLHAITEGDIERNISKGTEGCFFLIIDEIDVTLRQKLYLWKDQSHDPLSHDPRGTKRKSMFETRLQIIQQLASVLAYLHSKSIIYRDLKPDNIGFNKNGVLKLFDFGTAKELKLANEYYDGTYNLTGIVGSYRYMAPEVASLKRYNLSADVYSFGVLSWQVLALHAPFEDLDPEVKQSFARDRLRPKIDARGKHSQWPKKIRLMLAKCWNDDMSKRPSCEEILSTVRQEKIKSYQ